MSDLDRQATGVPDAPTAEQCERCGGTGEIHGTSGGDGYGNRCCGEFDWEATCPECEGKGFIYV